MKLPASPDGEHVEIRTPVEMGDCVRTAQIPESPLLLQSALLSGLDSLVELC